MDDVKSIILEKYELEYQNMSKLTALFEILGLADFDRRRNDYFSIE